MIWWDSVYWHSIPKEHKNPNNTVIPRGLVPVPPSVQFNSVQLLSRVWLCDPMNCSMPGLPVHHQLLKSIQAHVPWIDPTISLLPKIHLCSDSFQSALHIYRFWICGFSQSWIASLDVESTGKEDWLYFKSTLCLFEDRIITKLPCLLQIFCFHLNFTNCAPSFSSKYSELRGKKKSWNILRWSGVCD